MNPRDEFAARRRELQDEFADLLLPTVTTAVATQDWDQVLAQAEQLYEQVLAKEGGTVTAAVGDERLNRVLAELMRNFRKSTPDSSPDVISLLIALAVMNAATAAAIAQQDGLMQEWVTMHDNKVRTAHANADGQQRPIGENFDIGGVEMPYPGWPVAPVELWINCRCVLRAVPVQFVTDTENLGHTESQPVSGEAMAKTDVLEEEQTRDPDVAPVPWHGVLAPEGIKSGDGRMFAMDSLRHRDLPLPLTWQKISADGHNQNVTVAKIEKLEKIDGLVHASGHFLLTPEADEVQGLIAEFGRYGVSIDADEAVAEYDDDDVLMFSDARISAACIVSIPAFAEAFVSLGAHPVLDAVVEAAADDIVDEDKECSDDPDAPNYREDCGKEDGPPFAVDGTEFTAGYFDEIENFKDLAPGKTEDGPGWLTHPVDTDRLRDYWVRGPGAAKIGWGTPGDFNRCRVNVAEYVKPQYLSGYCANRHYDALGFWPGEHHDAESVSFSEGEASPAISLAASGGWCAPSEWFKDPKLKKPTSMSFRTDERGTEVWGHLAEWGVCHIGIGGVCTVAPHSATDYAYFMLGQIDTDAGPQRVGNLTIDTSHAPLSLRARPAASHYDNTGTVWADVAVGEDEFGIWYHGWVRPGTTEETLYAAKASGKVSGDWREIVQGSEELELIAGLVVNVEGFQKTKPRVGILAGAQTALVAAGVVEPNTGTITVKYGLSDQDKTDIAKAVANELAAKEARKAKVASLREKVKN